MGDVVYKHKTEQNQHPNGGGGEEWKGRVTYSCVDGVHGK